MSLSRFWNEVSQGAEPDEIRIAADPVVQDRGKSDLQKLIAETQRKMEAAVRLQTGRNKG